MLITHCFAQRRDARVKHSEKRPTALVSKPSVDTVRFYKFGVFSARIPDLVYSEEYMQCATTGPRNSATWAAAPLYKWKTYAQLRRLRRSGMGTLEM